MPTDPNPQASSLWQTFRLSDNPDAVQINANAIKSARDQGYSDQQIADHLATVYPSLLVKHLASSGNGAAAQPNYYPNRQPSLKHATLATATIRLSNTSPRIRAASVPKCKKR